MTITFTPRFSSAVAFQLAREAWELTLDNATTNINRVPREQDAASTLLTRVTEALVGLEERARYLNQELYIHNRLPDDYGISYGNGVFLREEYGIPERKDSAAKVLRLALILGGLVRVETRSGETLRPPVAVATWFDEDRKHDGYKLYLRPAIG